MNDDEKAYLGALEELCSFYSNKGKSQRELWVAENFLKGINENFQPGQLTKKLPDEGLIDILYRSNENADFEIKSITNVYTNVSPGNNVITEDEKTTEIYKKLRGVIKKCRDLDTLFIDEISKVFNQQFLNENNEFRSFDLNYISGYGFFLKETEKYTMKYNNIIDEIKNVDLLFYCSRHHVEKITRDQIKSEDFKRFGWRSISCLMGGQSIVLYASITAPEFLKQRIKN